MIRGALVCLKAAGIHYILWIFLAPEPVTFIRQRPLSGRLRGSHASTATTLAPFVNNLPVGAKVTDTANHGRKKTQRGREEEQTLPIAPLSIETLEFLGICHFALPPVPDVNLRCQIL